MIDMGLVLSYLLCLFSSSSSLCKYFFLATLGNHRLGRYVNVILVNFPKL